MRCGVPGFVGFVGVSGLSMWVVDIAVVVVLAQELAHTSIRFGLGRFTTVEEVDYAVEQCVRVRQAC